LINGEEFIVNFEKTSLLANNAYKRQYTERKDRCIEIHIAYYGSPAVAKIRFNVDIDKESLISKIQKAIDHKVSIRKEIEDRKNHQLAMLESMRKHYYKKDCIALFVERIYLHQGVISMYVEDIGNIYINAETGKFDRFSPVEIKGMSIEQLLA